jgi:hydroxymethylglutaryl-CoA reductase (NADPH)
MLVKVVPPVYLPVLLPVSRTSQSFGAGFERFMGSWTSFVGNPILSKWIVIALALSVFLNGYILKGIAAAAARARELRNGSATAAIALEDESIKEKAVTQKARVEQTVIEKLPVKQDTVVEQPLDQPVPVARVRIAPPASSTLEKVLCDFDRARCAGH